MWTTRQTCCSSWFFSFSCSSFRTVSFCWLLSSILCMASLASSSSRRKLSQAPRVLSSSARHSASSSAACHISDTIFNLVRQLNASHHHPLPETSSFPPHTINSAHPLYGYPYFSVVSTFPLFGKTSVSHPPPFLVYKYILILPPTRFVGCA